MGLYGLFLVEFPVFAHLRKSFLKQAAFRLAKA
jgi:hypothetical protein